jgi:hypothetical protein
MLDFAVVYGNCIYSRPIYGSVTWYVRFQASASVVEAFAVLECYAAYIGS